MATPWLAVRAIGYLALDAAIGWRLALFLTTGWAEGWYSSAAVGTALRLASTVAMAALVVAVDRPDH